MKKNTATIFTVIGIVVAAVAAIATVAYFVYRFMKKRELEAEDSLIFDCGGCDMDDCENCPVIADADEETEE